jgi:hypothetical protein
MEEAPQIHVARKTVQLGIFSPPEVVAGLANGRFLPTDLAWTNGLAAWKPLGEWPEFAAALSVPASPLEAEPAPVAELIPWEQGKSLGSFFATIKAAVFAPRETLSGGRFAFGDWLAFCYLALAVTLPFQLIGLFAFGDKNAQVADFLLKLGLHDQANQILSSPPQPKAFQLIGLALAPLFYAFAGVLHFLGQKLFRHPVSLERTVSAYLLAFAVVIVLGAPFQLLGFNLGLQLALGVLLVIPMAVVFFRALGAATGLSAWVQLGVACLVVFVVCCCCCMLPATILGAAFAAH